MQAPVSIYLIDKRSFIVHVAVSLGLRFWGLNRIKRALLYQLGDELTLALKSFGTTGASRHFAVLFWIAEPSRFSKCKEKSTHTRLRRWTNPRFQKLRFPSLRRRHHARIVGSRIGYIDPSEHGWRECAALRRRLPSATSCHAKRSF